MSVEQEIEQEQLVVTHSKEIEQLPIITQRDYADNAFVFLFSCYVTAITVQLLLFVPIISPLATRIPFIVLGLGLILASLQMFSKRPVTKGIIFGVLLGSLLGL